MFGRLKLTPVATAMTFLVLPTMAAAQDGGRSRVLVPYFEATAGAEENFGRQASEDLREMMLALPFHTPVEEDEIEEQAERFNMEMEDLNCTLSIQLAVQVNVPVLICASYTQAPAPDRSFTVNASIRTVATSDQFVLDPFTVPRNGRQQAAQQIYDAFERYNTLIRSAQICADYAASQQWESALRNCDESLAINPNAMSTRYMRARILFQMERREEALADYDKVLEMDPLNEEALQTAGFLATNLGDDERGRTYYRRYLEVNPGNVGVRLRIAGQMAEAGDPTGAIEFIQPGLEVDPNSIELLDLKGTFSLLAAQDVVAQHRAANPTATGLAPGAGELYRQAIEAYMRVFEVQGNEFSVERLFAIVTAHMQLEDFASAISMSERIFTIHPEETRVMSHYADALHRTGRLEDALAALDRIIAVEPDHPNASMRKGMWLIAVQRLEDAVTALAPTAKDAATADNAANLIFNEGYTNGFQKQDWAYSIRGMLAAKSIPNISPRMREQLNFWHGFSIMQRTMPLAAPQDLAAARATLTPFQESQALLNQAGQYPASVNMDMATLMQGLATYIEIQEAIIRRGY